MKNRYVEKVKEAYCGNVKPIIDKLFSKTAVIRTGKRKIVYYPIKVLSVVLVITLVVVLAGSFVASFVGTKSIDVSFELGSNYNAVGINGDVLIYNNKNVRAIDDGGKTLWQINETLSEPLVEIGGKNILLADLAGNHYAASYKGGKKVNEYQLGNDIISAKITKKGYAVFATDTDGYKGKVMLFNKKGKEIYAWNSGSGYITDVDITDNGRYLGVAQMVTDGGAVDARIQIIDTGRGEVISSVDRKGETAVELKFNSLNKLLVVTDNHIVGYTKHGKESFSISLEGKEAKKYNIDSDKLIAVSTIDNRGNSVLELYSHSGKLKGAYTALGDIHAVAVEKSKAVVFEQQGIVRVSSRGKLREVVDTANDIKDIGYFGGGNRVLAVGASNAEIVSVK